MSKYGLLTPAQIISVFIFLLLSQLIIGYQPSSVSLYIGTILAIVNRICLPFCTPLCSQSYLSWLFSLWSDVWERRLPKRTALENDLYEVSRGQAMTCESNSRWKIIACIGQVFAEYGSQCGGLRWHGLQYFLLRRDVWSYADDLRSGANISSEFILLIQVWCGTVSFEILVQDKVQQGVEVKPSYDDIGCMADSGRLHECKWRP